MKRDIAQMMNTAPSAKVNIDLNSFFPVQFVSPSNVDEHNILGFLGFESTDFKLLGVGADGLVLRARDVKTKALMAVKLYQNKTELEREIIMYKKLYAKATHLRPYIVDVIRGYIFYNGVLNMEFLLDALHARDSVASTYTTGVLVLQLMNGSVAQLMPELCVGGLLQQQFLDFLTTAKAAALADSVSHNDLHSGNIAYFWTNKQRHELQFRLIDFARSSFSIFGNADEWNQVIAVAKSAFPLPFIECLGYYYSGFGDVGTSSIVINCGRVKIFETRRFVFKLHMSEGTGAISEYQNEVNNCAVLLQSEMQPFIVVVRQSLPFKTSPVQISTLLSYFNVEFIKDSLRKRLIFHTDSLDVDHLQFFGGCMMMDSMLGNLSNIKPPRSVKHATFLALLGNGTEFRNSLGVWVAAAFKAAVRTKFHHGDLSLGHVLCDFDTKVEGQHGPIFRLCGFEKSEVLNVNPNDKHLMRPIEVEWNRLRAQLLHNLSINAYSRIPDGSPLSKFDYGNAKEELSFLERINLFRCRSFSMLSKTNAHSNFYFGLAFNRIVFFLKYTPGYECAMFLDDHVPNTKNLIESGIMVRRFYNEEMVRKHVYPLMTSAPDPYACRGFTNEVSTSYGEWIGLLGRVQALAHYVGMHILEHHESLDYAESTSF